MRSDNVDCVLGGYLTEPGRVTRTIICGMGGTPESTTIGSGERTTKAHAALPNNVMVRYLDFSDSEFNLGPTPPGENITSVLATGELERSSSKYILTAVVLATKVNQCFVDTISLRLSGWHNVTYAAYVVPLVAGNLLGLSEAQKGFTDPDTVIESPTSGLRESVTSRR
jgi:2-methylcitrate dehydratase PrpD